MLESLCLVYVVNGILSSIRVKKIAKETEIGAAMGMKNASHMKLHLGPAVGPTQILKI